jgi:hypothetical protein
MPYGYTGQNLINQTVKNSGVFSISDVADLEKQGKFGGSLELIEEQTFSNVASVEFTAIQENKYDVHFLQCENIQAHTDSSRLVIQLSNDNGSTYETTNYQYAMQYGSSAGTFSEVRNTSYTAFYSSSDMGTGTNETCNMYWYLYNLGNSSKYSFSTHQLTEFDKNAQFRMVFGGNTYTVAETINAIKVLGQNNTSNISGTIKLYGVKQL